jgi:hypothetical protein
MFRIARSKLIQTISSIKSVITFYLSIHVRWPARPAELWAGLDFFGSFCIKAKRTEIYKNVRKNLSILSFACAKERTKEKHTGNDIQPLPDALIELQCYC